LIAAQKALDKECWERASWELDEAESRAKEAHGDERPFMWRGARPVTRESIDFYREALLRLPGADREQIGEEYQDAKAMMDEWDRRVGIAPLREKYERALRAWHKAGMRMARTKPTTLAGAAALVNYARRDLVASKGSGSDWNLPALKTAADALTRMNAEASQ
jgi:hypothetical protein